MALLAGGLIGGVLLGGWQARPNPVATEPPTANPQFPPPPGVVPPTAAPTEVSTTPKLWRNQPIGDGDTVFIIHGSGFIPLTQVTVTLAGRGSARYRPTVDRVGTFNYAIDQGHVFWKGQIPAGLHLVVVTGAGGRRASISFTVQPAPPVRLPGSTRGLPAGSTTPGR